MNLPIGSKWYTSICRGKFMGGGSEPITDILAPQQKCATSKRLLKKSERVIDSMRKSLFIDENFDEEYRLRFAS